MHKEYAIRLQNVSKIYKLYGSQRDQLVDILGLRRIGIKPKAVSKEFTALENVSLEVPRGHRIGIVGRNGAGKTTLLKLLCGNFAPTSGSVEVNGEVQALMSVGLGFHPEYTGRENVAASLQYSGLRRNEYQQAMDGIIEFCELSDYLDQPFKTYSLGMQSRLMFAAATAVRPDILIIDEVLGAGDAYFVAKSKTRVQKLVNSGCTMLLVSHSMQQVLELCDEAIWLEQGRIRMRGQAFSVVKAYEEHMYGSVANYKEGVIQAESAPAVIVDDAPTSDVDDNATRVNTLVVRKPVREFYQQEPLFVPHAEPAIFPEQSPPLCFDFIAKGGISRWSSTVGIKFCGFTIQDERGVGNKLVAMRPARFMMTLKAEVEGEFCCRYGVTIFDLLGHCLINIVSPLDRYFIKPEEYHPVDLVFNPLQLGAGDYTVSISAHRFAQLEVFNSTPRYDLLNRSFNFSVELPDSLRAIEPQFYHSAEWCLFR